MNCELCGGACVRAGGPWKSPLWRCRACAKTWRGPAFEQPAEEIRVPVPVRDDGVVTVEKMRKVLGQPADEDEGPTEERLRDMLGKGVGPYLAKIEEMEGREGRAGEREAELARLRGEAAELKAEVSRLRTERLAGGEDGGSARARAKIERILAENME